MFRLRTYDEVSSTNEVVKAALRAGEPEGLAVCARTQTGGYGRQGRVWVSPEGGLYLSLLLRPQVPAEQLSMLSLVVGVAVRRACVSLVGETSSDGILLKWPNDVVCSARPVGAGGQRDAAAYPGTEYSRVPRSARTQVRVA
ncbi:MAG: biotin--[Eggerthellaceae bacterium]|nr:biotin--[acetyl-CoA-carboxylase] ligase [Eggerthellaceae bacterium]